MLVLVLRSKAQGFHGPRPEKQPRERTRGPELSYSRETLAVLTTIWEAAGYSLVGVAEGSCAAVDAVDPSVLWDLPGALAAGAAILRNSGFL